MGPLLFAWISISLYHQVLRQPNLEQAGRSLLGAFTGDRAWMIWLSVLLMPVNWMLETYKWHLLVNRFQRLSFLKSLEAVLSGLSLAMNTPNRIGEYGARVLYLEPSFRLKGVALTILCSISQLLVTLVMGWIGLLVLEPLLGGMLQQQGASLVLLRAFAYLVLAVTILTGVFYFRMQWLVRVLRLVPWINRRFSFATVLEQLHGRLMVTVILYSFLRFFVFAIQYLLLWQALDAQLDWWYGFWSVAVIFLVMSIIPTIAIAEIGIRGKVAVSIGGLLSANTLALLTGSVGIWLLNLALPALAGSIFLLTLKVYKER